MTNTILQDRRQVRAQGIVERSEVIPCDDLPGWFQVRDSVSGSGSWHLATVNRCDCYDSGKGNVCKHMRAVRAEEAALAQYCADWDSRSEQARAAADDAAWLADDVNRDAYSGPCGADGWPVLTCGTCGGHAESLMSHLGGRGTVTWALCTVDSSHPARRLS